MSIDPSQLPLKVGDKLENKYRIDGVLGQGAMGCVYAATHELLGDQVAIKCLLHQTSPTAMQRFLREAQVVRSIRSAHAVKVLEVGLYREQPFLIMERLHGEDLETSLQNNGRLPLPQVADILIQVCDALCEAHRDGVIHRDLKPSNIFISQGADGLPSVKVLDFGVAKVLRKENDTQEMLRTVGPVGTPLFMSPEQIQGRTIDARTDIWALGILIFHLLTEDFPFVASTIEGLSVQICTQPPRSLGDLRRDLPPGLVSLVASCLARSPDERPASVASVASALLPFATPAVGHLVPRIQRILAPPSSAAASAPSPPVSAEPTRAQAITAVSDPALETTAQEQAPVAPPRARRAPLVLPLVVVGLGLGALALRSAATTTGPATPQISALAATASAPASAPVLSSVVVIESAAPAPSSAPATASAAPPQAPRKPPSPPGTPAKPPPAKQTSDPTQGAIRDRK